jgi:hypothetical protein
MLTRVIVRGYCDCDYKGAATIRIAGSSNAKLMASEIKRLKRFTGSSQCC